jgi:hypothetical protein
VVALVADRSKAVDELRGGGDGAHTLYVRLRSQVRGHLRAQGDFFEVRPLPVVLLVFHVVSLGGATLRRDLCALFAVRPGFLCVVA